MTHAPLKTDRKWQIQCIHAQAAELGELEFDVKFDMNYKAGIGKSTALEAAQALWKKIDKACTGKRGKSDVLRRVCALEGGGDGANYHYHCAIKSQGMTAHELAALLLVTWNKFDEAGRFSVAQVVDPNKAYEMLSYLLKGYDTVCTDTSTVLGSRDDQRRSPRSEL